MKIRGLYAIQQQDRTLLEDELRSKAQSEILRQIGEQILSAYSGNIIKEEPNESYLYGRYYLDIEVDVAL